MYVYNLYNITSTMWKSLFSLVSVLLELSLIMADCLVAVVDYYDYPLSWFAATWPISLGHNILIGILSLNLPFCVLLIMACHRHLNNMIMFFIINFFLFFYIYCSRKRRRRVVLYLSLSLSLFVIFSCFTNTQVNNIIYMQLNKPTNFFPVYIPTRRYNICPFWLLVS